MRTVSWISSLDVGCRHQLAILLHFTGDAEERLEFEADVGLGEVGLDLLDERLIAAEMGCCGCTVNAGAIVSTVAAGDEGRDQFALAFGECAGAGEQYRDQRVERACVLGRKAMAPRMPKRPGESGMWGMGILYI
jgi:hypothetical protein